MKDKKNILIIVPTYLPHVGGIENTVYEVARGLVKKNYNVDVITPRLWGGKKSETVEGFNVYRVGKPVKNKYLKFLYYQYEEKKQIKKLLKKGKKYDLVNLIYSFPQSLLFFWLKRKLKVPIVISEHHYGTGSDICSPKENPLFVNQLCGLVMKKADMTTVTGLTQEEYVKEYARDANMITIPSGVNTKKFKIGNKNKILLKKYNVKGPMILSVGRLNIRKNYTDLIKSILVVKKKYPNVKLLIAGKGEEQKNLEKVIKENKLEKNVILLGLIPYLDLVKFYQSADLFAFTSKFEGFGLIYCEALLCGIPVVSYDILAAKDVMKDNNLAFLSKQNPISMGNKIIDILNSDFSKKDKELASKDIYDKYSWDSCIDKHNQLFKKLIKN